MKTRLALGAVVVTLLGVAAMTAAVAPPKTVPLTIAADPTEGLGGVTYQQQASHDAELARLAAEQARQEAEAREARAAEAQARAQARASRSRPAPAATSVPTDGASVWVVLADCETGDGKVGPPYSMNPTSNGQFEGAFQFLNSTWRGMKAAAGYAHAYDAPYSVQLQAAQELVARSGWGQFPSCSRRMRAAGYI